MKKQESTRFDLVQLSGGRYSIQPHGTNLGARTEIVGTVRITLDHRKKTARMHLNYTSSFPYTSGGEPEIVAEYEAAKFAVYKKACKMFHGYKVFPNWSGKAAQLLD